jgi:hypothetical protein
MLAECGPFNNQTQKAELQRINGWGGTEMPTNNLCIGQKIIFQRAILCL